MQRTKQLKRTDMDIIESFLSLLDEKNFEKITVVDIIQKAAISRSTFYKHFVDKYALLDSICTYYTEKFFNILQSSFHLQGEHVFQQVNHLLVNYFEQYQSIIKKLMRIPNSHFSFTTTFQTYFKKYLSHFTILNDMEIEMAAGILSNFFLYCLKNDIGLTNYATTFIKSYINVTAQIFFSQFEEKEQLLKETIYSQFAMPKE